MLLTLPSVAMGSSAAKRCGAFFGFVLAAAAASFDGESGSPIALAPAQGKGGHLAVGAAWANNTTGTFALDVDNVVVDQ